MQQNKSRLMKLENSQMENKAYMFFMFVNTGSGANVGNTLLQQQVQRIQFVLPSENDDDIHYRCNIFIYNMRVNRDQGFKRLKMQSQNPMNKCYAIVCGGDGTVMWIVTEMVKHEIKVTSVPIGVIPLGTGNDFSRQLGWGHQRSNLLEKQFKNLKKEIRKWIKAKEQYFDIWDIEAEVYDDGKFQKVEGGRNVVIQGKNYKKTFCNYFSFGIDGKIGYSFDMHRTKSRLGNLAMYGCMGVIKTMTRTKNLDELLDSIEINQGPKKVLKRLSISTNIQTEKLEESSLPVFMKCESSLFAQENSPSFQKNYYNILALNINSYTGGVKDIWQKAKNGFIKNSEKAQYEDVSTCDGKLEIVSFGSSFGIAMERVFGGFSKKVAQGSGPFCFSFHRYENNPKHRTYLQIDGQFIRFTNPKRVTIRLSQFVPKGKIKVIRNLGSQK